MFGDLPINIDDSLQEHLLYKSIGFSIKPYTIDYVYEKHSFMPLHWHGELQVNWVFDGNIEFLIDGENVTIDKSEFIFINQNVLHSSNSVRGDAKTLCINFSLDFLNPKIFDDYIRPILENPKFTHLVLPTTDIFLKYFDIILDEIEIEHDESVRETKSGNYFRVVNLINLILEEVVLRYDEREFSVSNEHSDILNQLLLYIHENYKNKITIGDLINHVHISKTFLNDLFQKYTKKSPIQYITAYRLQIAQELILSTNDSISRVSEECGFGTLSFFVEKFRKTYKLSPLKYRKKFQQIK